MKPLLARSVPYLELDFFAAQLNGFYFEVDTNGGDKCGVECVITKSEENACLADPRVAYQQQFEEEIVTLFGHFSWKSNFFFQTDKNFRLQWARKEIEETNKCKKSINLLFRWRFRETHKEAQIEKCFQSYGNIHMKFEKQKLSGDSW